MAASKRKSKKSARDDEPLSFEGALEQLEQTVSKLEEGELPLEEALVLFESGVAASRRCNETLEAAERRIEILVAERGGNETEPFPEDLSDDAFDEQEDDEFED